MKRIELSVAVMQGWARLDAGQRDKFFEAFVRAALRLDRLHLREWLRQRLCSHPMRAVDPANFALSDRDVAALLESLVSKLKDIRMPLALQAGLWGALSGSALVLGALLAWLAPIPQRVIAAIMAFGSGVLISALSFELMDHAFRAGGFDSTSIGFLSGALVYTTANIWISRRGAVRRKRSGQNAEAMPAGTDAGLAIAVGALLDGIPESIVIGISMIAGGAVSWVAVIAIFLSNVPEGLSSSAGMKKAGHSVIYVFGLWTGIALISGLSSLIGYAVFSGFSQQVIAATEAVAAGAILSMIADTMIPEAFEVARDFAGLITVVCGFLASFVLSKLGG